MKKLSFLGVVIYFLGWIYLIVAWVVNLIKFINCDFASPYKDEIIHGLGIFIAPISMITCWF
ncbi:hypothetical protein HX096_12810 [Empedobacter falsenii]|uniref:hypothetical protein n=1 Tax=Empedobacter falsenii TaxID=343874 RepID=UPI00257866B1|nr:hypothetical protein [Empedobacter falsenii]MDM1548734.1 hypothetical protein [Empedobacter falsenii]